MYSPELVDDELFLFTLLKRDVPSGAVIAAEMDVDSIDNLPLITFSARGGDQAGNGPGLWTCPLTIRVFAEGQDSTWELCRTLYRIIHEWEIPGNGIVEDVAVVSTVTDLSKFSRDASVDMQGKNVTQYTGSFELIIKNN